MDNESLQHKLDRVRRGGHTYDPMDDCSDDTRRALGEVAELQFRGRYSEALAHSERALRHDLHQWRLWVAQASALFDLGRSRDGLEAVLRALSLNANSGELWYRVGEAFLKLERSPEALRCYVVAERLGSKRAADAVADVTEYLQLHGVAKGVIEGIVGQVLELLPLEPASAQQMAALLVALKLGQTAEPRAAPDRGGVA